MPLLIANTLLASKRSVPRKKRAWRFFERSRDNARSNDSQALEAQREKTTSNYELASVRRYSPFGEPIRDDDPKNTLNPFKFSTKYLDHESGLLYYGYRYYNPDTGRWLNRDPIEENGGANLYAFAENNGINTTDYLGLKKLALKYITSDFGIKDWLWAGRPIRVENLSEILADIEAQIGSNLDPTGECGDCIQNLTITSHSGLEGYVGFSPIEGVSYGQPDNYSPGSQFSNGDAAAAFSSLGKYFCKDGQLYLEQCSAGGGDDGTRTLRDLSRRIGVPVSAPAVDTRIGKQARCTKTAFPSGDVNLTGDCNADFCLKKPSKSVFRR